MKINSIRMYQAVTYATKMHTSFNINNSNQSNLKLNMSIEPGIGVRVAGTRGTILVPFANIGEINIDEVEAVEEAPTQEKSKKKSDKA